MFLRQNLFDHLSGRVIPPNGYIWHFIIEDTCFESQLHKSHRIHTTIIDFLLFIINMTVSWTEVMVTSYLTWHFALFSSNLVKAWKFFAGMFGAFFIHINALHRKGNTIINDREDKGLHTKNINKKKHTHTHAHTKEEWTKEKSMLLTWCCRGCPLPSLWHYGMPQHWELFPVIFKPQFI